MIEVIKKESPEEVAIAFAGHIIKHIKEKGKISIALSGGTTPKILFNLLAEEFSKDVDWNRVHFFWGDERCVPPDHEESNYLMAKTHLFDHITISEENIHRIRGENDPQEEAIRYSKEIKDQLELTKGYPEFDLIMLGLGTDGHTASIFPHQMELLTSDQICEVANHPDSGQKRVTLTGQVINHAKEVSFLVTGSSKADKIRDILKKDATFDRYPAYHIQPFHGSLYWYLDAGASSML